MMKSIVSRGNLKLTGTATNPARMMPNIVAMNSARLAERIATRSPRASLRAESARATPVASVSICR